MHIGDYTAHILVDGQELEEHGIKFDPGPPHKATCWVASEAGKTFAVKWHCHTKTRRTGNVGWVVVDGARCGGLSMFPGRLGDDEDTMVMSGIISDTKIRDFMFSHMELSDDDRLLNKELPEGFGEISLEIEHGKLVRDPHFCHEDTDFPGPADNGKVHETSHKAAHHRVSLGQEKPREDQSSFSHLQKIIHQRTLMFIFKYRPIALLRANGLVPAPAPAPDSCANPKPDPDRSQSINLHIAELEKGKQYLETLKRAHQELEALLEVPMSKRIKYEDSPPRKRFRSVSVIDLTRD